MLHDFYCNWIISLDHNPFQNVTDNNWLFFPTTTSREMLYCCAHLCNFKPCQTTSIENKHFLAYHHPSSWASFSFRILFIFINIYSTIPVQLLHTFNRPLFSFIQFQRPYTINDLVLLEIYIMQYGNICYSTTTTYG